jgi:hypothetical protein
VLPLVLATAVTSGRAAATPDLTPRVTTVLLNTQARVLYPVYDAAGAPIGSAAWRVSRAVGNCCENYFAITSQGRILNFGGNFLRFSDNKGLSWSEVRPIEPLVSAEGAVTVAPNGDVIGMTWDPYSGDRVLAFKLDAATQAWRYSETPLHNPGFDWPWIAVARGPFTFAGTTYPYIVLLRGGTVSKETVSVSFNGLDYVSMSSRLVESLLNAPRAANLPVVADPAGRPTGTSRSSSRASRRWPAGARCRARPRRSRTARGRSRPARPAGRASGLRTARRRGAH